MGTLTRFPRRPVDPLPKSLRLSDEDLEYWGDLFDRHGLRTVTRFARFLSLTEDSRMKLVEAQAHVRRNAEARV